MSDRTKTVPVAARMDPIFVVGCSRSGTTLLQSILNQHPSLVSFPETNILHTILDDLDYRRFGRLMGRRRIPLYLLKRLVNRFGYTLSYSPRKFHAYLSALGREDLRHLVPAKTRSMARVFAAFRSVLEAMALGQRYIEKTPQNIFCIEFIQQRIPDALFVHIVRDGKETVASLCTAAQNHAGFRARFGGPRGLLKAISYWNNALRISHRYGRHPRHAIVRYEDVVADPRKALEPIARFLGIELTDNMFQYNTSGIIFESEDHKKPYSSVIMVQPKKFETLFSAEEKNTVAARILSADAYFPRRF